MIAPPTMSMKRAASTLAFALLESVHSIAPAQDSQTPRASLSPQQLQDAVRVAREASEERLKRPEMASRGSDDRREYVVALERLDLKEPPKRARARG